VPLSLVYPDKLKMLRGRWRHATEIIINAGGMKLTPTFLESFLVGKNVRNIGKSVRNIGLK
jgi:hypothetical protein